MYKMTRMKWTLGVIGICLVLLFSGCSAQPYYYTSAPQPMYRVGPGPIGGCDRFCEIKNECKDKASISTLAEYQQWLKDMSQGYYNYELICADVPPPAK